MTKRISLRSIIFSFLLAVGLWVYASMRATFEVIMDVPLEILLPEGKSVKNVMPTTIPIRVKGMGWNLLNVFYVNQTVKSVISISRLRGDSVQYIITPDDIRAGFRSPVLLAIEDIMTDDIALLTDVVTFKRVPVIAAVKTTLRQGFITVDSLRVVPDSITISGSPNILNGLTHWYTDSLVLTNVSESLNASVRLRDTLRSVVSLSQRSVLCSQRIDRLAEVTLYDVAVALTPEGTLPSSHILSPRRLTLTLRGGINDIASVTHSMVRAEIPTSSILNDTLGRIAPIISVPRTMKLLSVHPPVLRHKRIVEK